MSKNKGSNELESLKKELASQKITEKKREDELIIASKELSFQNEEKKKRADELIIATKELTFQNEEKKKRADELIIATKELAFQNEEKHKRAEELIIATKELALQNEETKRISKELFIANKELALQTQEMKKRATELIIANQELALQNQETKRISKELVIANEELVFQNEEKKKRADEFIIATKEVGYEKNRADELKIANQELAFQNEEKKNRADELVIANRELAFQNEEKKNRADELIIANTELIFQNEEKKNRADELIVANKELVFQNEEKKNRADELIIANKELTFQNEEKKNRADELTIANKELSDYKYALEQSSIIAITDHKGIIKHVNENFCKISKYTAEELIGQDHKIISSGYHTKEFIKNLWTTIANGKIWRGELKNKAKDGTIYWVDTTIVSFLNEKGKPFQYLAIRKDITNRKNIEEQLHSLNSQNTAILTSLPANVALINTEGVIVSVNKAWVDFGKVNGSKASNQNIGDNYLTISESATGEAGGTGRQIAAGIRAVLAGAIEEFTLEYPCHSPHEQIWFQVKVTPSKDEVITGAVIMHINITEKTQFEIQKEKMIEDIVQRNKNLEQFSYIISHNLRLPVANILGLIYLLQQVDTPKDTLDYIKSSINISANKLDEIIRDLNDILQTKDKVEQRRELVSFENIASDIYVSIEKAIEEEKVKITWDFSEAPEMLTIKSYLYSIFYNLISNSLKYRQADNPSLIEIKSSIIDDKIFLSFKDNGLGINLAKQGDMVFGLYKRFHIEHAEGKGIGLYMVKTQVEAMGGSISIKSEVNKGTEFILEFSVK